MENLLVLRSGILAYRDDDLVYLNPWKAATSGESAFVLDEGRMIAELRPHIPPRADKVTGPAGTAVLYSADDIVSPLEPDGYEPFK